MTGVDIVMFGDYVGGMTSEQAQTMDKANKPCTRWCHGDEHAEGCWHHPDCTGRTHRDVTDGLAAVLPAEWTAEWDHTGGNCGCISIVGPARFDGPAVIVTGEDVYSYSDIDWPIDNNTFTVGIYQTYDDLGCASEDTEYEVGDGEEWLAATVLSAIARLEN